MEFQRYSASSPRGLRDPKLEKFGGRRTRFARLPREPGGRGPYRNKTEEVAPRVFGSCCDGARIARTVSRRRAHVSLPTVQLVYSGDTIQRITMRVHKGAKQTRNRFNGIFPLDSSVRTRISRFS
ncbi:unnamed protein product [Nesidiocoris tenuis]|uniref:Uncharacterized protein n=1 Tax=Nesidiocoris tenuis TaxID=355587 RepID=A0A6H5GUF3_9HEMI|nr:unnamed protein product [Nesidiocoris tenuis]